MKPTLTILTALLLAPLAAQDQTNSSLSPTTVRDDLWLFAVPPNADAGYFENAGYRGGSHMTPVEGAHCTPSNPGRTEALIRTP